MRGVECSGDLERNNHNTCSCGALFYVLALKFKNSLHSYRKMASFFQFRSNFLTLIMMLNLQRRQKGISQLAFAILDTKGEYKRYCSTAKLHHIMMKMKYNLSL